LVSLEAGIVLSHANRPWLPRFVGRDIDRLVVADPDETLFVMVRQLTAPDLWQVEHAETGEELLRMLRMGRVRLVIVNLAMLDDCPGLADNLSGRSRRGLSVVVTVDHHSESNERRARMIGPAFYAPKPFGIVLLGTVLEGALSGAV
jgi:DNA-binding response OmpR family regulator